MCPVGGLGTKKMIINPMRKPIYFIMAFTAIMLVVTSCKKESDGPDDNPLEIVNPDEVITFNLGFWDGYSDDNAENQICVLSDTVCYETTDGTWVHYFSDGTQNDNIWYIANSHFLASQTAAVTIYITEMFNFGLDYSSRYENCRISSVGAVTGLTSINSVPTSGWGERLSANAGEGYVVKAEGIAIGYRFVSYSRIWVKSLIQGATGGVVGAVVQYQPNWKKIITPITNQLHGVKVTFNYAEWTAKYFYATVLSSGDLSITCKPDYRDEYSLRNYAPSIAGVIRTSLGSFSGNTDDYGVVYYETANYGQYDNFNWEVQSSTQTITAIDLNAHTISGRVEQLMKDESKGYSDIPLTVVFDDAAWTAQ